MAGYDGSIRIIAGMDHSRFDRGISSMTNSINKFGSTLKKMAGLIGVAFGVAAIVNFGREAVKAASSLNDAWMGLESIVAGQGKSFSKAKSFINDYISDGLVPLENAVTAYKNLAARGYSTEQIEKTMTALKDAAAFGRQASYSLGDAVTSATEGLKNENSILVDNAGVTKNVAKMWDEYAKSIGTTANKLTQEQKIQAEVNGIMQETRFQTGDAAKLVNTYSGQIALLGYNFQNLKVQAGNALMPIAQAALPGINAIISALTKLAQVFAQVTALLFGKSTQIKTNAGVEASASSAADATDQLASATEGAGAASKKAAKDMKGIQAGFDELNILANKAAAGLNGAAGGLDMSGEDLELPEIDEGGELFADAEISPKLVAEIEAFKESIGKIWEVFKRSWEENGPSVIESGKQAIISLYELAKSIGRAFTEAWTGGEGLEFLNAVYALLETLLGIIADIADAWKTAFDNVGTEFFESILFKLTEILRLLNSIGEAFREAWNDGSGAEICETILQIFTNINDVIGIIAMKIREAWEANGNGVAIWNAILDVVQTVLGFVERLTAATLRWAKNLDLEPLISAFRRLTEAVNPLVEVITNGLAWAYENVLLPFGKWFLEELSPVALDLLTEAIKFITEVIETFQPLAKWLWDSFLKPVAEWTGGVIVDVLQSLVKALSSFSDWISKNQALVQAITLIVLDFMLAWKVVDAASEIIEIIGAFTSLINIGNLVTTVISAVSSVFAFLTSPIGLVVAAVAGLIAILAILVTHWEEISQAAATAWGAVVGAWNAAGEWFRENVTEPLGAAFEAVVGVIKNAINGAVGAVEGLINSVIKAVNWLITQLNKIKFDIPDWVPAVGGKSFGFNIQKVSEVKLPRLANGAVIPPNQQFAAILGDQRSGKNLEAPAALIRQMVMEGIQAAGGLGRGGNMTVIMEIDGREFGRASYKYGTAEQQRVGVRLTGGRA